jgi:flagellar assembly factor FliW
MTTMIEQGVHLELVEPLPGFALDGAFTLTGIDDDGVLYSMRSVRDPQLRFVLTPANVFFTDYCPDLVPAVAGTLGSQDIEVLLILTVGTGLADSTANLRAPVAVSRSTGRAVQVVLEDETLPMHQPLLAS